VRKQTNKKQTNKKKIFRLFLDGWRQSKEGRERTFKFFCVCRVPIFLSAATVMMVVRLFRVLLFSIIMLLKLHLFHSSLSLSQFTPLFLFLVLSYSFPLSFSSFLSSAFRGGS
jgi:hypothetical protein